MTTYRKTWAQIDLDAISYNFKQIKKMVGEETRVLAAVKANAYGHGLIDISQHLEKLSVDFLGTSSIDEAITLRKASIKSDILNLSNLLMDEIEAVLNFKITPAVADLKVAQALNKRAVTLDKNIPVHIKIDTGMGRIGIWHKEGLSFFRKLKSFNNLIIEGIYTHFPSAEDNKDFTLKQIEEFSSLVKEINTIGVKPKYLHSANSAALISYRKAHFNLVRPGLALYGIHPALEAEDKLKLKPALSFKTRIAFLKEVPKGRSISYGRTFISSKRTRIATLPVGYADGYSHLLSNKAKVLIRGRFYPVIGRVCMDQTMIDAGLKEDIRIGDEVILIGKQGKEQITAGDLALICNTIPYQVLCWVSNRVPRVYYTKK